MWVSPLGALGTSGRGGESPAPHISLFISSLEGLVISWLLAATGQHAPIVVEEATAGSFFLFGLGEPSFKMMDLCEEVIHRGRNKNTPIIPHKETVFL